MNYIEMAKNIAKEKRTIEDEKIKEIEKDKQIKTSIINNLANILKKELKKWNELGFTYEDKDTDSASLTKNNDILLFQCHWTFWTARFSDDCEEDCEGPTITVTYCLDNETRHFRHVYDPYELVDSCMKSIAEYLSKYF